MRRAAVLALLLALPACAGPQRPVDLGFKEVPSDVILGAHATPTPEPGPLATPSAQGSLVAPPPPSVVVLPPPTFETSSEPPPPVAPPADPVCATADPLQAPTTEAPPALHNAPVKATYIFRNVGSYAISGADARKGAFPKTSLRTVGNIVASPSGNAFTYDVSELLGNVTTTTTYDVIGSSLVPQAQPPGLYLKAVKSVRGTSTSSFTPSPELELAAFPFVRGASVSSSGVDPQSATSMQFTSTVIGKARVDACGTPLDSWVLDLTKGKLLSPTQNLDFAATYNVGTQFGGIFLRDRTTFAGTDGSDGVNRNNTATITSAPKLP